NQEPTPVAPIAPLILDDDLGDDIRADVVSIERDILHPVKIAARDVENSFNAFARADAGNGVTEDGGLLERGPSSGDRLWMVIDAESMEEVKPFLQRQAA